MAANPNNQHSLESMQIFVKFSYTIIEAKFLKKIKKKLGTVHTAEVAARVLTWVCLHFQLGNKKGVARKYSHFQISDKK